MMILSGKTNDSMKKKNNVSEVERQKRETELYILFYQDEDNIHIHQFSKYHFRIFYKGDHIDAWPVSKKYYASWFSGSKIYKSVQEIKKAFQSRPQVKITTS
jgi:hypothetical protein